MRRHVAKRRQQKRVERFIGHAVVLDLLAVRRFVGDVVGRVGDDEVGVEAVHEPGHVVRVGRVAAQHPVTPERPQVARPDKGRHLLRVQLAIVVPYVLVMHLGKQVVDLRRVKARRAQVVPGELKVGQQIGQRLRLPFAHRLVEGDVERLFRLRILDMHDHAVDLRHALGQQHLVALVPAHNVTRDLIPDHGVDIAEVVQAALDFFVGGIAGPKVLAGVVFSGLQLFDADSPQIHLSVHFIILSGCVSSHHSVTKATDSTFFSFLDVVVKSCYNMTTPRRCPYES